MPINLGYLALIIGIAVIVFAAFWTTTHIWKSAETGATAFQAFMTGLAIILAGAWYLVERRGFPHADLTQSLTVSPAGKGYAAVEVTLTFKNLGSGLLKLRHLDSRLQKIFPSDLDIKRIAELPRDAWPSHFPDGSRMYHHAELMWPTIRWYNGPIENDVEPGEADIIVVTFLVSCQVQKVRVSSEVNDGKPSDQGDQVLWWKAAGIASTTEACKKGGQPN